PAFTESAIQPPLGLISAKLFTDNFAGATSECSWQAAQPSDAKSVFPFSALPGSRTNVISPVGAIGWPMCDSAVAGIGARDSPGGCQSTRNSYPAPLL